MKMFGYELRKIKKRAQTALTLPGVGTFENLYTGGLSTRLSSVHRALKIYEDFLKIAPLKCTKDNHQFFQVLKKPNNFQTKSDLYAAIVFEYFLFGSFRARLGFDNKGQVNKILPYRSHQIRAYSRKGEYGDSGSIDQNGYYYRDYRGRILQDYQVFEIRDSLYAVSDQLNPPGRLQVFADTFQQASSTLAYRKDLSESGLKGASVLTGLPDSDDESLKSVQKAIQEFTKSSSAGQILSLPAGYSVSPLAVDQSPSKLLEFLSSVGDTEIARLFQVPVELISRSDSKTGGAGANSLKESYRLFIKSSVASFLQCIGDSFTNLVDDGSRFHYKVDALRASDLRETAQFLSQLVKNEVLKPGQALDWLKGED